MRVLTTAFVLSALTLASGCSSKTEDAAAAAGGSSAAVAPVAAGASGSRLTAKFLTGGGAHQLVGFHDSMRNEDCTFQAAETPQKMRCLPPVAAASPSGFFSDAACQVAAAVLPSCGADVKYGLALHAGGGDCGQVVSEVRKVLPTSAPIYLPASNGCTVQPASRTPQASPLVALGDVVPWTDFVDATEMIIAGAGVSERVLVASDGARQHVGFHDPKLDLDCTFQLIDDLSVRCVPEASTGPVLYSDSACATPFLVSGFSSGGGGCTTPDPATANLWIEPALTACAGIRNLYSLRDFSDPSSASDTAIYDYSVEGPSSGPGPAAPTCNTAGNLSPRLSGNEKAIDATLTGSLPIVQRFNSGSDRLVPALVWPAGSATTLVPGWRDTERNVDCTFALASDGKMRCLPVASSATLYHTDDACKSPGLLAILNDDSCFDSHSFAIVASASCPPATTVYALGAGATGFPESIATPTGQCAKATGGASVMGALDATVVDPTQFVEGVPATE